MHLFDFENKFEETNVQKLRIGNDFMGDGEPIPNIPGIMNNTGVVWSGADLIAGIFTSKVNPRIILWVSVIATTPAKIIEQNVRFNHEEQIEVIGHLIKQYESDVVELEKLQNSDSKSLMKIGNLLPEVKSDFTKQNNPTNIQVKIAQEWGIGHRQDDRLDHVVRFISGYIRMKIFSLFKI